MAKSAGNGADGRGRRDDRSIQERLASLGVQLGDARARRAGATPQARRGNALGLAFRIAVELIAGVVLGGLIGWWLDGMLGTSPVLLLIFFVLGASAGILNVVRTAQAMQKEAGVATGRDLPNSDDD